MLVLCPCCYQCCLVETGAFHTIWGWNHLRLLRLTEILATRSLLIWLFKFPILEMDRLRHKEEGTETLKQPMLLTILYSLVHFVLISNRTLRTSTSSFWLLLLSSSFLTLVMSTQRYPVVSTCQGNKTLSPINLGLKGLSDACWTGTFISFLRPSQVRLVAFVHRVGVCAKAW